MRFISCVFMVCLFLAPAAGATSDMDVLVIEANSYAVQEFPDQGIYHPDAEQIFKNFDFWPGRASPGHA